MPRQDYDKIVKLACKPKNAPPKAKYLEALIAATWDENALADVSRALTLRLKDQNPVVVFKALITLHQLMMPSGSTDKLLNYLSRSDQLRLRNVQAGSDGGGYHPPSNLGTYAYYLDTRIRAYRELQHDIVSLQRESNRKSTGKSANSEARRLRHLEVDKGLLREVKQVQRVLDALIRCTFYDDDLRDENTVLAFRLIVKDLLVLFQAGNEGVCNILEHYFEMSKVDATESFEIYKSFIKQTDKVVDFLAVARKLNNIINVPVPNLKHAPTSLVKALEEYLNDPNFEQNRMEYKRSLGVVEGRQASPMPKDGDKGGSTPAAASAPPPKPPTPVANAQQKIQDFLDSIETDQQNVNTAAQRSMSLPLGGMGQMNPMMTCMPANQFGQMPMNGMGGMGSMNPMMTMPLQMNMTGQPNPFRQSTMIFPQQTGFMPQMGSMGFQGMPQQTSGFLQPQTTGMTAGQMAFGSPQRQNSMPMFDGQETLQSFPQQQPQPTGFLQAQTTGSNPFRQSMLPGNRAQSTSPFHAQDPQRSGSAPPSSVPGPLQAQKTGSKNPFAPPGGVPAAQPPQPKGPSMYELAAQRYQPSAATMNTMHGNLDPLAPSDSSSGAKGGGAMSDIASAFAIDRPQQQQQDLMSLGSLSLNDTGSGSSGFLQPQRTGYGGSAVKPFKPTSNFGSTLMESLPPIPEPAASPVGTQPTGFPFSAAGGSGAGSPFGMPGGSPFGQPGQTGQSAGQNAFGQQNTGNAFGQQNTGQNAFSNAFSGSSAFGQANGSAGFGQQPGQSQPQLPAQSQSQPQSQSSPFGLSPSPVQAQKTGFQPTSSFGQQLAASATGAAPSTLSSQPTGFQPQSAFGQSLQAGQGHQSSQAGQSAFGMGGGAGISGGAGMSGAGAGGTGSGSGLQPQATGSNPFRQSLMPGMTGMGGGGMSPFPFQQSQPQQQTSLF